MEWSPWYKFTEKEPEVGQYIEVLLVPCDCRFCHVTRHVHGEGHAPFKFRCIVLNISDKGVESVPKLDRAGNVYAEEWRHPINGQEIEKRTKETINA